MSDNFFSYMQNRGLISLVNDEEGFTKLCKSGPLDEKGNRQAIYCGFDPTAKSLHIGHLVPLLNLRRAQDFGFTPVILFGGATGLIGDPTGKTDMRPMNSKQKIAEYVINFSNLVKHYFRFDVPNPPVFVNNIDWIGPLSWLDFSREVGVHFTVAKLLSSEVNKTRYEHGGLTFMEMGYQLLQAYDFLHLFKNYNTIIQTGGNDQWSNILGGSDLIRKVEGKRAYCFTAPLITDSAGNKLGKTAGNAVWIDGSLLSPYEFFQYLRNVPDETVETLFKVYTFMPQEEITNIVHKNNEINKTKELLAFEVTKLVHGEEEANKALQASRALFSNDGNLDGAPTAFISIKDIFEDLNIVNLLVKIGLSPSKSEARRLISGNGLQINDSKLTDVNYILSEKDFKHSCGGLLIKKGKKEYHVVKLQNE